MSMGCFQETFTLGTSPRATQDFTLDQMVRVNVQLEVSLEQLSLYCSITAASEGHLPSPRPVSPCHPRAFLLLVGQQTWMDQASQTRMDLVLSDLR